ncbi:MAG: DUF373 family protein [Thaumarchaeota archaeon]|nr:DUF373 family protein [Candidatus Calditenuaceae archaeon]MDW8042838.1 DUF373 family protein [Nitrososphaerota archaeon]
MAEEGAARRVLILVVDEDDDVGRKTGWETPITGRDRNFLAAKDLLLADPEEADANAMFAAVKLYDELSRKGDSVVEIATVSGKPGGGLESDRKLSQEIERVIAEFPADESIVVTDGPLSESVSAIITSRVKVTSVRKLVVKQNPSIETTWILLGKYFRTALFESEYARVMLGIPGTFLLAIGVLFYYNLLTPATFLILIGIALAVRGFGIDTAVASFFRKLQTVPARPALYQVRVYVGISSAILIVVALVAGINSVTAYIAQNFPPPSAGAQDPVFWAQRMPLLAGVMLLSSVDLLVISATISLLYDLFYQIYLRSVRVVRSATALVFLVFLWALLRALGSYLVRGEEIYITQMILIVIMGIASLATMYILLSAVGLGFLRRGRAAGEGEAG